MQHYAERSPHCLGGDWDAERREGREKKIEGRVERGKEGETDDRSSGVEG